MEQETGAPSASGDSSITWGSSFVNNLTFLLNMCLCAFSVCILRGLNTISVFFPVSVNLQLAPLIPRTSWFVLYIWLGEGTCVYIKPVFESKGVAANRSVSMPSPLGLCYPVGLGPVSLYVWV